MYPPYYLICCAKLEIPVLVKDGRPFFIHISFDYVYRKHIEQHLRSFAAEIEPLDKCNFSLECRLNCLHIQNIWKILCSCNTAKIRRSFPTKCLVEQEILLSSWRRNIVCGKTKICCPSSESFIIPTDWKKNRHTQTITE